VKYTTKDIGDILAPATAKLHSVTFIEEVSIDSRTIINPSKTLFFALAGTWRDGHEFVEHAYDQGVRSFVVSSLASSDQYPEANFFIVKNVLKALQKLAKYHATCFPNLKKIGITGSNGKTIIKEWLYQMIYDLFHVVKSPKSFNSQIGMALSLLNIESTHQVGIFEAGISRVGEMKHHTEMLHPTIGVMTNLGSAHDEGFSSRAEKLAEKMQLFLGVQTLIYCTDHMEIDTYVTSVLSTLTTLTWGSSKQANIRILANSVRHNIRNIRVQYEQEEVVLQLRYIDYTSYENAMHCVAIMCHLGLSLAEIKVRLLRISGLHMRMEMTSGIHQSILINDAYSADLDALQVALDFASQQAGERSKMAILSAFDQSGQDEELVFKKILEQLRHYGFKELIYLSDRIHDAKNAALRVTFFPSKAALMEKIPTLDFTRKVILIKGARKFGLEDISDRLSDNGHSATLQINLNALENNLRAYRKYIHSDSGVIAVVKASAYGTGSAEVAQLLERNEVDYLAVAFADEGIKLRRAGIQTDIMVFNPDPTSLAEIIRYQLEPEVYGFDQLQQIISYCQQNDEKIDIHLKLDTGMHRLGFLKSDIPQLCTTLANSDQIRIKTVFSHLASSEDPKDDAYTYRQFEAFDEMFDSVCKGLNIKPKRHILNSGGISRFADRQYDFVRLGIGLYGIDANPEMYSSLQKVHSLSASLIQVKRLKKGQSVGYNRQTILDRDATIGIVNIGYADGVLRHLGNNNYSFMIQGQPVPILGNVCMDVTIVDLTSITEARVGMPVVIFDQNHPIEEMAKAGMTIPYEILSRISERVKRRFVKE